MLTRHSTRNITRPAKATKDWLKERITALALIPLTVWFACFLARLPATSARELPEWLSRPLHSLPLLAFIFISAYHAELGLHAVMDDYVHGPRIKGCGLLVIRLALLGVLLLSAIALFSLYQTH